MSDALKEIYKNASKLHYYFDQAVPIDLYRGQKVPDFEGGEPILFPHPGFVRKNGSKRLPDVKIVERDGKMFVLGCRCVKGDYRGISTFDKINPILKDFLWFKLSKGTALPPGLAITQDDDIPGKTNHFTIAPKDDMPLELFQVLLNTLASNLQKL